MNELVVVELTLHRDEAAHLKRSPIPRANEIRSKSIHVCARLGPAYKPIYRRAAVPAEDHYRIPQVPADVFEKPTHALQVRDFDRSGGVVKPSPLALRANGHLSKSEVVGKVHVPLDSRYPLNTLPANNVTGAVTAAIIAAMSMPGRGDVSANPIAHTLTRHVIHIATPRTARRTTPRPSMKSHTRVRKPITSATTASSSAPPAVR